MIKIRLVNPHFHVLSSYFPLEGLKFRNKYNYLKRFHFEFSKRDVRRFIYIAARYVALRALESGVVGIVAMDRDPEIVAKGFEEVGIKYKVGPPLKDINEEDEKIDLKCVRRLLDEVKKENVFIGIANERETSLDLILEAYEFARKKGIPIHMHLGEVKEDVEAFVRREGKSFSQVFVEMGLGDVEWYFVHSVYDWIPGSKVIVNPRVNLQFSGDVNKDPNALIGTDVLSVSPSLNPLFEVPELIKALENPEIPLLLRRVEKNSEVLDVGNSYSLFDVRSIWEIFLRPQPTMAFVDGELLVDGGIYFDEDKREEIIFDFHSAREEVMKP